MSSLVVNPRSYLALVSRLNGRFMAPAIAERSRVKSSYINILHKGLLAKVAVLGISLALVAIALCRASETSRVLDGLSSHAWGLVYLWVGKAVLLVNAAAFIWHLVLVMWYRPANPHFSHLLTGVFFFLAESLCRRLFAVVSQFVTL